MPRMGWLIFGGLDGVFLMALTTSLLTSRPGALISVSICLAMSRSEYPVGGSGRNLIARPSFSDTSFIPPTLASNASILVLAFLTSHRKASVSDILE